MPRQRFIEPGFFSDDLMCFLPIEVGFLYIGSWVHADDYGNIEASPTQWRIWIMPCRNIPLENITEWQRLLQEAGRIIPYEVEGKKYYHLPTLARRLGKLTRRYARCPSYNQSKPVETSQNQFSKMTSTSTSKNTSMKRYRFSEEEREKVLSLLEYKGDREIMVVLLSLPGHWGKTPEEVVAEYNKFAEGIGKDMPFKERLNQAEAFRIWWQDKNLKRGWLAWRNWVGKKLR